MKKPEVSNQQPDNQLEARIAALETRLERLDPPKLQTREPYKVGSEVYSIADREGRNPMIVVGYEPLTGRILVNVNEGDPEPRSLQLVSVVPLEKCPNVDPSRVRFPHIEDPTVREYWETRRAAEFAAKIPPPLPQRPPGRYRRAD